MAPVDERVQIKGTRDDQVSAAATTAALACRASGAVVIEPADGMYGGGHGCVWPSTKA